MRRPILLLSLFCLPLSLPAVSAPPEAIPTVFADTPEALAGCPAVCVAVEDLDADAKAAGLSPDDLQATVQQGLKNAGIPVLDLAALTPDELVVKTRTGFATVNVNVNIVKQANDGPYAYSVELAVGENMKLVRAPQTLVFDAGTWRRGTIGISSTTRLKEAIRDRLGRLAKILATDFLTANPKK